MTRVASVGRAGKGVAAAAQSASRGKRMGVSVIAAAMAVAMIGVASSQGATHRAAAGNTATIAIFQEPDTLDPAAATLISTYQVLQSIFDPLMYEIGGKLTPGLASRMTVSKDSRVYTFTLKKGVKFQDGTPFNAQAVKFNFDRIVDKNYKAGTALGNLGPYDSTKVINPYKVQIRFKKPNASFENEVTTQPFGISSPTAIRKYGARLRGPSGRYRPIHLQAVAEGPEGPGRPQREVQVGAGRCREQQGRPSSPASRSGPCRTTLRRRTRCRRARSPSRRT